MRTNTSKSLLYLAALVLCLAASLTTMAAEAQIRPIPTVRPRPLPPEIEPVPEPPVVEPAPIPPPVPPIGVPPAAKPTQCQNIGMNTGPGVVAATSFGECTDFAPLPDPESGCQCVVSVRTRRREIVRPDENRPNDLLFQECVEHHGHPGCPADPANKKCGDGRHSAPYGNWGVRVRNAQLPATNPLQSPTVARMSGLQDCQQWPGTVQKTCGTEPCKQWHTCTCDQDLFTAGHFGNQPAAAFVSQDDALAGFFVVDSQSIACKPALNLKDFTFQANLELFELDSDASDFITTVPVTGKVRMTCGTIAGCSGDQDNVQLASNRVRAMARIEVRCDNRLEIGGDDDDDGGGGGPGDAGLCEGCGANSFCSIGLQCLADGICHRIPLGEQVDECIGANLIAGPPSPAPLQVVVSPASLAFAATLGAPAPPPRQLSISSNRNTMLPAFLSSNQPWLRVGSQTVGVASVSVQPAGLPPGNYSGAVLVSANEAVNSPLSVPVALSISSPPPAGGLTVFPSSLSFTAPLGGPAPPAQVLQIGSTGASLNWSVSDNASFVNESPPSGATPGATNVSINVGGLATGSYSATITVSAAGASPLNVPVFLTVNGFNPAAPVVNGFNPVSGPAGTQVEILGVNFNGVTAVTFNGVPSGSFPRLPNGNLLATVPNGASTGLIRVTNAGGIGASFTPFTVTAGAGPSIALFSPGSGRPGDRITIQGANFQNPSQVFFNGVPSPFVLFAGSNFLSAEVPSGATSGPITITTSGGSTTSSQSFVVTP